MADLVRCAPAVVAVVSLLVGCTHDFDAYAPAEGASDASTDAKVKPDGGAAPDVATPCAEPGALSYVGHCYFAITGNYDYQGAKALCITKGAHLVTITSTGERDVVRMVGNARERWIGLSRPTASGPNDASYQWLTGEPRAGFADWSAAEPDGSGLCVRAHAGISDWGDDLCTNGHDALCERE